MRISKVEIENFRNFDNVTVETSKSLLLVGANASGKSNFVHALRLVLDSSLSRRDLMLTADDFWRGDGLLPWRGRQIRISVELSDYEENSNLRSFLDNYLIDEPGVARLSYIYRPRGNVPADEAREQHYEFRIYGGSELSNEVETSLFKHLSIRFIDALRDASSELVARRMPLRSLLELYGIDGDTLNDVVEHIQQANNVIRGVRQVAELESDIDSRLSSMKEHIHELAPVIRLISDSSEDVVAALRILLDSERLMPINRTSLGLANLLFLAMYLLEIEKRESISTPIRENEYEYIILAVEEPEAHLHPHLQRLLFRDFLRRKHTPIILSTHSPHIASVTPLQSIIMFRQPSLNEGAQINSTARLTLSELEVRDIERYLDVSRAELLFSRAVIFVEGEAEIYLVPALARLTGYDLDRYGITICSVHSTNFAPYTKLAGPKGLNIPFAIITDGDMYSNLNTKGDSLGLDTSNLSDAELRAELESRGVAYHFGLKRSIDLLRVLLDDRDSVDAAVDAYNRMDWEGVIEKLAEHGILSNEWTLEISLIDCGFTELLIRALEECGGGPRVVSNLRKQVSEGLDVRSNLLKQIDKAGKGRIAQRLSAQIMNLEPMSCEIPGYVKDAIEYLINKLDDNSSTSSTDLEPTTEEEDELPF